MKQHLFILHLIFVCILSAISVYWMVSDIFSMGKSSIGSPFYFTCPAPLIIPLAFLSLGYLRQGPCSFYYFIPLILSVAAVLAAIILYSYENTHPDFAFIRSLSQYEDVVDSVNRGEIEINRDGLGALPDESQKDFTASMVAVSETSGRKTIYFQEGSDSFDSISWGYIHTSDGNPPGDDCTDWRELVPPTPNWYFCDAHRWIGLWE
jgi:hypothetical protein